MTCGTGTGGSPYWGEQDGIGTRASSDGETGRDIGQV